MLHANHTIALPCALCSDGKLINSPIKYYRSDDQCVRCPESQTIEEHVAIVYVVIGIILFIALRIYFWRSNASEVQSGFFPRTAKKDDSDTQYCTRFWSLQRMLTPRRMAFISTIGKVLGEDFSSSILT